MRYERVQRNITQIINRTEKVKLKKKNIYSSHSVGHHENLFLLCYIK